MMTYNKVAVELYVSSNKVRPNVNRGFATTDQKGKMVGLKVLLPARIEIGSKVEVIKPGWMVYFPEELLHTQLCKFTYECEAIEGRFMLVDFHHISIVENQLDKKL